MNEHLDLFSGIGGFAIAARCAGFRTVAFCESDERCGAFLEKQWGLPVHADIRELDGRQYSGISLLTGGPPCQPSSRAGKQGGERDDRWLWPEALRVLEEAKPDSVVFENPPGILDVGIDGILSEMGRLGYETQPFDIPACAVDSPQLRHRIWIVGFANCRGHGERKRIKERLSDGTGCAVADATESGRKRRDPERGENGCSSECLEGELANSKAKRLQIRSGLCETRSIIDGDQLTDGHWQNSVWVSCADGKLRRAPDDSFDVVDGLHRSVLGALGNAIVPQIATEILKAVRKVLK